ncbi:MAG: tRNA lysidine(34) synthetase TilS [Clostridia bacterium]|nr:tRNA lysidine(34) synthetase TilS [Clostridia bacterium]
MDLAKTVKAYIQERELIKAGDLVLLAVSGGVDSMTMAHILLLWQKELGYTLAIANFNHHLRPEAEEEGRFVAEFARRRRLPFFLGGEDIAALARGGNIQEVARRERYAYLRALLARLGGDAIAVAHHRDDQAETVLLHLLRGSGLTGLAAMAEKDGKLIRPLLGVSREQIAAYAAEQGIEYREDASNASVKYLRNRIRIELLPRLADYNPRIAESLCATADICRAEDELLDDLAENALAELWINDDNALNKSGFDQLPLALQRRVARKAFTMIMGDQRQLDFAQAESVLRLRDEQEAQLPGGLKAYVRGNIYFAAAKPPLPSYTGAYPLLIDGLWHRLADWGWEYRAAEKQDAAYAGGFSLVVPADICAGLTWRTRQSGMSVPSAGKKGRRKLKDIFIDNHIPVHQRGGWPLLTAAEEIIWICGLWQKEVRPTLKPILIQVRICDKISE